MGDWNIFQVPFAEERIYVCADGDGIRMEAGDIPYGWKMFSEEKTVKYRKTGAVYKSSRI